MKNRSLYLDEGCGSFFLFFLISQFCVYFCLRKHRKIRKKSYEIALKLLRFTLFNLKVLLVSEFCLHLQPKEPNEGIRLLRRVCPLDLKKNCRFLTNDVDDKRCKM